MLAQSIEEKDVLNVLIDLLITLLFAPSKYECKGGLVLTVDCVCVPVPPVCVITASTMSSSALSIFRPTILSSSCASINGCVWTLRKESPLTYTQQITGGCRETGQLKAGALLSLDEAEAEPT